MRAVPAGLSAALSVLTLTLLAAPLGAQFRDRCSHERELANNVAVSADALARIEAGAGSLTVRGVAGLREARVRGSACATTAALLDQVSIAVVREGSGVRIRTLFPERTLRNEQARIDLVIEVPAGMDAEIQDGSGSMEISGLGRVHIDDGSGDITVRDTRGALTIDDGSGDITLADIGGAITIDDGSGSIDIRGAGGNVEIEDGSGGITIRDVHGSVRIADSSGSIDVRVVRGDFMVSRNGSGSISHRDIAGRVELPRKR
ncbi:MAG TPA: DUF4097 family beta strand repeat-containing protein [Longimicrobiales bacterium]|nr:DUF4097 family beta strand repeat-containing protein [Longimicrobiales bacterium]